MHVGWVADLLLSRVDASAANVFAETQGAWLSCMQISAGNISLGTISADCVVDHWM